MKNKTLKIWLRKNGLLCRRYEYKAPTKLRISHTVYPNGKPQKSEHGEHEWYGIKG